MSSFYPAGAGDVVREIFELRRLLQGTPKLNVLIAVGYLLNGQDSIDHETVERTLMLDRVSDTDTVLYTLEVEEKGIQKIVFSALFEGTTYIIEKYVRGAWEADLDLWYRTARADRPRLLTAGAA